MKAEHNYHLVNPSPLPLFTSLSVLVLMVGAILAMHGGIGGKIIFPIGLILLVSCMFSWWWEVIKEGRVDKAHTKIVQKGLTLGMVFFILSEMMFFVAFFWGLFKSFLDPVHVLDDVWAQGLSQWPPAGIHTLDPWNFPLLNTLILLLSGTTVTWAHDAIVKNKSKTVVQALLYTVILGAIFSMVQAYEYYHASFKITEGIYPSVFYLATGFHGLHVLIGTIFLAVCLYRAKNNHFDKSHNHLGFTFAAWYWHFVDVIWLFLFVFLYVWGG